MSISKEEACHIASEWWSVMTWHDPGVCMYALGSTGKVQSEDHRNDLLSYIDKDCMPIAMKRTESHECTDDCTDPESEDCPVQDVEQLAYLRDYIVHAPLEPCHAT